MLKRRSGYIPTLRELTANARRLDKLRGGRHRDGLREMTRSRAMWLLRRWLAVQRAKLARTYVATGVPELARNLTRLRTAWHRAHPVNAPALTAATPVRGTAQVQRESAPERDTGRRVGAHSIRRLGNTAEHRQLINAIMAGMHALRDGELAPGEMTWRDARLADRFAL